MGLTYSIQGPRKIEQNMTGLVPLVGVNYPVNTTLLKQHAGFLRDYF